MNYKYLSEEEYATLDEYLEDELPYYHVLKEVSKESLLACNSDLSREDITLEDVFEKIREVAEDKAAVVGFNELEEMEECWEAHKEEFQEWAEEQAATMGLEGGALAYLGQHLGFDLNDVFNERHRFNNLETFINAFINNNCWNVNEYIDNLDEDEVTSSSPSSTM